MNQILVAEGLARYIDTGGSSAYARLLSLAQDKAEREELGLWGRPPVVATVAPVEAVAAPVAGPTGSVPQGPYCAELSGSQYFATDDPRVTQLNQGSLIFYRSESDARRAGKRPAPAAAELAFGAGEDDADALLAAGKDLYSQAIAAGNTSRRDDLYGESFGKFTAAMQIYSQLVDTAPDDPALSEKLRETMQFRYGAMKQRRF